MVPLRGFGIAVYFSLRRDFRYALTVAVQCKEGSYVYENNIKMGRTNYSPNPFLMLLLKKIICSNVTFLLPPFDLVSLIILVQ